MQARNLETFLVCKMQRNYSLSWRQITREKNVCIDCRPQIRIVYSKPQCNQRGPWIGIIWLFVLVNFSFSYNTIFPFKSSSISMALSASLVFILAWFMNCMARWLVDCPGPLIFQVLHYFVCKFGLKFSWSVVFWQLQFHFVIKTWKERHWWIAFILSA